MQKTITHGSVEIYSESFGRPDAVPVLLIAGAMAPAIFWDESFCQAFSAEGYHVIRFDHRDIGRSTHFPQSAPESAIALPYSIDDMVEDARLVLEAHSSGAAHIVGHSLGSSIAQLFALAHPDMTLSLTALSGPILAYGDVPYVETDPALIEALWQVLMANPLYQDFERGAPEFMKIWRILNGELELDEAMANRYTRALYDTEIIGPAWNHTNVQNGIRDILTELEQLDRPLLFIHGEKDYLPSNPENTKRLAQHLPQAEFFLLQGGGHMFFHQKIWDILRQRILPHFRRLVGG